MSRTAGLQASSHAATIYWAVRDAGPRGISVGQLRVALAHMSEKTRTSSLHRMKEAGLITQPADIRHSGIYLVDASCVPVRILGCPLLRLLALIGDCPGGMSAEVLSDETGLLPVEVQKALQPEVLAGRLLVDSTDAPKVYRVREPVAEPAAAEPAAAEPAAAPLGVVQFVAATVAPEPPVNVRAALLVGDRLHLDLPVVQLLLPADVTRALFRALDRLQGATP